MSIHSEGIIFECRFNDDKSTNTASYEITPITNLIFNMDVDADRVNKRIRDLSYYTNYNVSDGLMSDKYYLSNIHVATEMNTVGEQNKKFTGGANYIISEDDSYYYDNIVADSSMRTDTNTDFSGVVTTAITTLVDKICFSGVPVTETLGTINSLQQFEYLENRGYVHNYLNYQGQVTSELQKRSHVKTDEGAFLGKKKGHNGTYKLSYKYDNKLHDDNDMQFGVKVWFDIYENTDQLIGKSMVKVANGSSGIDSSIANNDTYYNCGTNNNYNVYNTNDTFDVGKEWGIADNKIAGENDKYLFYKDNDGIINLSFTPKYTRRYDFVTESGNKIFINNSEKNSDILNKGEAYDIQLRLGDNGDSYGSLFINDNSGIQLNQSQTLYNGLSYYDISFTNNCVDIFKAVNGNNSCRLYIVDNLGNIIKSTSDSEINFLWQAGGKYRMFVENNGNAISNFCIENKGECEIEKNNNVTSDNTKFYTFYPVAKNYFTLTSDSIFSLYDENYRAIGSSGQVLMEKQKYIIGLSGKANGSASFNHNVNTTSVNYIGQDYTANTSLDEVFSININNPCGYKLKNNCDIYNSSWESLYTDVDEFYIGNVGEYYIVNSTRSANFKIEYDAKYLPISDSVISNNENACAYYINARQEKFVEMGNLGSSGYIIMDENYSIIPYDHGYCLPKGKGYLIVGANQGEFTLKEYSLNITITISYDDNKTINVQYRASYNLGIPVKDNYDFDGWYCDGKAITNKEGASLSPLSKDMNFTVTPTWTAREAYVCFEDNGDIKWWTGNAFGDESSRKLTEVSKENFWLNFKDTFKNLENGKKQGHYIGNIEAKWNAETRIYTLEFEWIVKKYNLIFDFETNKINNLNIEYSFGGTIGDTQLLTNPSSDTVINNARKYYKFKGWKIQVFDSIVLSNTFFDIEYKNYDFAPNNFDTTINVTLDAIWEPDHYNISFDTNGGANIDPIVIDYGSMVEGLPNAVKAHYDFKGWLYEGKAFPKESGTIYDMPHSITIKANWEPTVYTINFIDDK